MHAGEFPYRFQVGSYECLAVSDGAARLPGRGLFSRSVPRQDLDEALRPYYIDQSTGEVEIFYTCVLIEAGTLRILVDTGSGARSANVGRLVPRLRAAGFEPADIDTVVLTHAHYDHMGGVRDADGALTFSRARHVMSRAEHDFWTGDADLSRVELDDADETGYWVTFAREYIEAMDGRLDLVDDGAEIASGVRVVATPGHTPGHIAIEVTSDGEHLLVAGDVGYHPVHLEHPDWYTPFDSLPDRVAGSRQRFCERAAAQDARILLYHGAFPGLGYVCAGTPWRWAAAALPGAV